MSLNGSSTLNTPEDVTKRELYSSDKGVICNNILNDDDKRLNKVSLQYPTLIINLKIPLIGVTIHIIDLH